MKRILLDTNVVVSGILWSGSPRYLINADMRGEAQFFCSDRTITELQRILNGKKFDPKFEASGLSREG